MYSHARLFLAALALVLLFAPSSSAQTPASVGSGRGVLFQRCMLSAAGTVRCRLQNNTGVFRVPELDGLQSIAGRAAVLAGGTVRTWDAAESSSPEIGDLAGLTGVAEVIEAQGSRCYRLQDGTLRCASMNQLRAPPAALAGFTGAASLGSSGAVLCALRADGSVWCWGQAYGFSPTADGRDTRAAPGPVADVAGAQQLVLGNRHVCVRTASGGVRCWGANDHGQLGDGTTARRRGVVNVAGLADVRSIVSGGGHACALMRDRTVRCWGANDHGQLGDGSTTARSTPVPARGLTAVEQVYAAGETTCARRSDGSVHCWGYNLAGVLGDGTGADRSVPGPVSLRRPVTALYLSLAHAWAVTDDGALYAWGSNVWGQLGDPSAAADRASPAPIAGLANVEAVWSTSLLHFARVRGGAVYAWGRNPVLSVLVEGLTDVVSIASSSTHVCTLDRAGAMRCWGSNSVGELGDGTTVARQGPSATPVLTEVASLSVAEHYTCAAMRDGTARCWGDGEGVGTPAGPRPAVVAGLTNVASVSAGPAHACAALRDGTARCWGANSVGQLGDGSTAERDAPVPVAGLVNVASISTGAAHTCAALRDGSVQCWGSNEQGQLGDRTFRAHASPAPVPGLAGVVEVAAGVNSTCARAREGAPWCWGYETVDIDNAAGSGLYVPSCPAAARVTGVPALRELVNGADTGYSVSGTIVRWDGIVGLGACPMSERELETARGSTAPPSVAAGPATGTCAFLAPAAFHLRAADEVRSSGREYPAGTPATVLAGGTQLRRGTRSHRVRVTDGGAEGFMFLSAAQLPAGCTVR